MSAAADGNLLYGILALQMDFVTRDELVEAMHDWAGEKQTPLGQILRRRGYLDEERQRAVQARLHEQLRPGLPEGGSVAASQPGEGTVAERTTGYEGSGTATGARPSADVRYQRLREHAT